MVNSSKFVSAMYEGESLEQYPSLKSALGLTQYILGTSNVLEFRLSNHSPLAYFLSSDIYSCKTLKGFCLFMHVSFGYQNAPFSTK